MRDQSAGPVLVRRRSDSNAASDIVQDVSDLELDNATDDLDDQSYPSSIRDRNNPLGISVGRTSNASNNFDGGLAAAMAAAALQAGTWVTKHSNKNKRKRIKIWLDPNSARVCWHPTNLAKSFFIDDVREVRVGAESRNARDDAQIPDKHENRWMTIVYEPPERSKGRTIKTMHLIMDSEVVLLYWNEALSTVARERSEIMNALSTSTDKSERGMAMAWRQVMTRKGSNAEEVFTLDDARWLCKKLEINCSDHAVRTHYKSCDLLNSGRLDYSHYKDFVNSFKGRKDIQNVFRNVNMGTDLDIELRDFLTFLKNDQHIDVEKERSYWEGVFDRFAKPAQNRPALPDAEKDPNQKSLSLKNFQNFLTSGFNAPLALSKGEVTLNQPLNEYFISSSHNTYLLGRQVAGASSVEGYIQALIRGCRCIEIDCWDGDNGRPMVTHGRTMTSKVPFEDCVSTIGKYAFHSTPYPLIVSLEVHCNPEQQKAMVDLMMKYWKDVVVTEPLITNAVSLPSPEELKGRILVKVKAADEEVDPLLSAESTTGRSRARSLGSAFNRTPSLDRYGVTSTPLVASPPTISPTDLVNGHVSTPPLGSVTTGSPSSSASDSDDNAFEKPRKRKTSKIVPELGSLGVYAQGIKYNGFQAAEARTANHIFSFSESTFDKLCTKENDSRTSLERHNLRYLMRVYPAARRIDSSNFNPLQAWRRGVQMAALNWQTYDVHQQVNEAMFAAGSDRLGYVLKPEELRHAKHLPIADTIPEAPGKKEKKGKKIVKFTVNIRSAQRLPRPRNQPPDTAMNPFIEFEMYSAEDKALGIAKGEGGIDASAPSGASGIGLPVRKRSRIVEGNGFDPIYHDSITMTVETKYPSLIFVRWTVWSTPDPRIYSSNSSLLATFTAKLSSLQQGYRHLPLFNPHGEQYREAKLFVNIKKEAPVPVELADNAYGIMEPSPSPRPEPLRQERSWRSRVFSRNSSQRRTSNHPTDEVAGVISRTSSMDRDN
jgi:phosphatidylinositol phospholipase C delta